MMSWGMLVRKPPPATRSAWGANSLAMALMCLIDRYAVVMPPIPITSQRSAVRTWDSTASGARQALASKTWTECPWRMTMAASSAMP